MEPLLTTEDVAEFFRVKPKTIREWVQEGRLTAVSHPGNRGLRFRREDIEATVAPATEASS